MIILRPALAPMLAPVAYEPVKNTPSTGWSSSAAPVLPPPMTGMKTSSGMPEATSISAMCMPVSVANSDGLYKHRIARQQRGNENVAADEVRIVPRRDVGDDAQRLVRNPFLEFLLVVGEDFLLAQHARGFGQEEIDAPEQAVEFVARLLDRLADLAGERLRELLRASR